MNAIHRQVMIAIAADECVQLEDDCDWEACFGDPQALEAWGTVRVTVTYNEPPAKKWEPLPPYEGLTLHDM